MALLVDIPSTKSPRSGPAQTLKIVAVNFKENKIRLSAPIIKAWKFKRISFTFIDTFRKI